MKILYVEDSAVLNKYVTKALKNLGHTVDEAADGIKGLWLAENGHYDVILLDVMLPGIDGFTILETLRNSGDNTPILLLTAKDTLEDKLHGLNAGADDYLVKPFELAELIARLAALFRRSTNEVSQSQQIGPLTFDSHLKRFSVRGTELHLNRREFTLLELLMRKSGSILSRTEIENTIYESSVDLMSNSVNSSVSILRKKLAQLDSTPLIHTRRGLGYVLEVI